MSLLLCSSGFLPFVALVEAEKRQIWLLGAPSNVSVEERGRSVGRQCAALERMTFFTGETEGQATSVREPRRAVG